MKIRNFLVAGAMAASTAVVAALPAAAVSCPSGSINGSANTLAECNVEADNSLMSTVDTIIKVIVSVLGIVAVAVIVLGGVMYVTSTGDPGKTKKAKDTIMYGVIGLVIAILAYAIVNFVLSSIFS